MDAIHEEHLARILENRRRRGVTAGYQSTRQYGKFPESLGEFPDEMRETTRGTVESPEVKRPVQRTVTSPMPASPLAASPKPSPSSPKSAVGSPKIFYEPPRTEKVMSPALASVSTHHSPTIGAAEIAAMAEEQRVLHENQRAQNAKVDEIHKNMNENFKALMAAMERGYLSRQPSTTTTPSKIMPLTYGGGQGSMTGHHPTGGGHHSQGNMPYAPIAKRVQSYNDKSSTKSSHPGLGRLPPPLTLPNGPTAAAPSAATHLDLRSAMSLMKTGEWFIKWDGKQIQAAARHVWYDFARCTLNWGPEKFTRSPFSGDLPLEEVTHVTTDQMNEFDGDVDRLFFLLIIHTPRRTLYLATEKRAKLDCWYEALTIVSLYNRMHRSGVAGRALSSD